MVFWLFSYNGLRQAIAIAIIFYSLSFIKKRKKIAFFITVLFAMLFHKSAIIAAPLYFLYSEKERKKEQRYLIYTVTGIILSLLFFQLVAMKFGYQGYLNSQYANLDANKKTFAALGIIEQLIFIIPFFIWRKKLINAEKFNRFYFNTLIVFLFVQLLTFKIVIAIRLVFYFELVIIPISIEFIKNKSKFKSDYKYILLYILLYLFLYRFIYIYSGSGNVIPYSIF